jgi:hypothetical protein
MSLAPSSAFMQALTLGGLGVLGVSQFRQPSSSTEPQ